MPIRIFVETDPVLPQIEVAQGNEFTIDLLEAHTHLFSFGENLGAPDCPLPLGRFPYCRTRQPVVVDWWDNDAPISSSEPPRLTTISNWKQSEKDVEWNGETYTWSKDLQFLKFIDLPQRTRQPLEVALACDDPEVIRMLESYGWRVVDAMRVSRAIMPYRRYITSSHGEFTVAKDQVVRLKSGWFSDRSACYLAAGKPVITQDTFFGKYVPTGEGLFAYSDMDGILESIETVNSDYDRHSRAAREIALEYFDAEKIVGDLLSRAGA